MQPPPRPLRPPRRTHRSRTPGAFASIAVVATFAAIATSCGNPSPDASTDATAAITATAATTATTAGTATPADADASATGTGTPGNTATTGTSTPDATTGADAPAPTDDDTSPPAAADPSPAWASDGRVALALSVHVERHDSELQDQAVFDAHIATLEQLALTAEQTGARLSFELSTVFVQAVDRWGSMFVEDMAARGHGVSQHSGDRSTDGLSGSARIDELTAQRAAIEAHGVEVTYLSGGCAADGSWVEDLVAAGFTGVGGTVEFCLGSLDDATLPEGMDWVRDCANAAVCHDTLPIQLERLLHPWTTNSSATWLDDDPTGRLVVVPGMESTGLAEMSMSGEADLATASSQWESLLDTAVAAATPGRVNAVDVVLSVGPTPDWDVLGVLLDAATSRVSAGTVAWATMSEIVHAASLEAGAAADPPATVTDSEPSTGAGVPPGGGGRVPPPGGSSPMPPGQRPVDGTLPP